MAAIGLTSWSELALGTTRYGETAPEGLTQDCPFLWLPGAPQIITHMVPSSTVHPSKYMGRGPARLECVLQLAGSDLTNFLADLQTESERHASFVWADGAEVYCHVNAGTIGAIDRFAQRGMATGTKLLRVSFGFACHDQQLYRAIRNMLTAQEASLEDGTATGWTATGGSTIANVADAGGHGTKALAVTCTAQYHGACVSRYVPVVVGQSYTASYYLRWDTSAPAAPNLVPSIDWYDSGSVLLSSSTGTPLAATTSFQRATTSAVAPANAAYARPGAYWDGTTAGTFVFHVDEVQLEPYATVSNYDHPGSDPVLLGG